MSSQSENNTWVCFFLTGEVAFSTLSLESGYCGVKAGSELALKPRVASQS